jgi:hypothetical protein
MERTVLKRALCGLTLAALLLAAPCARADNTGDAERLFREGVALRDEGNLAAACPKFADSFALDPAPGTLVNLGDCEVRIGKMLAAIEHYKLAVSGFPKGDKRRDLVTQKVTATEARLAHLTIRVTPSVPDGAKITRDGVPFDRRLAGDTITLDPAKVTIVVSAEGHDDAVVEVEMGEGQTKDVYVDVGPKAKPRPVSPPPKATTVAPPQEASRPPLRTAGYIVGGIGVVGLGVGAVTGIMALSKAGTVRDHCDTTTYGCDSEGVSAAHDGNTLAPISTVGFIAGGALVAGGVVMILVSGKKKEASVSLAPDFSRAGGGATLIGRF